MLDRLHRMWLEIWQWKLVVHLGLDYVGALHQMGAFVQVVVFAGWDFFEIKYNIP
jgi:hypothetical protein